MSVVGGVIPAVVTPFARGGGAVDLDALDAHVAWLHARDRLHRPARHQRRGSVAVAGRAPRVIERLAGHPSGVTLLPGTGGTSLPETIELSRFAVEHGASPACSSRRPRSSRPSAAASSATTRRCSTRPAGRAGLPLQRPGLHGRADRGCARGGVARALRRARRGCQGQRRPRRALRRRPGRRSRADRPVREGRQGRRGVPGRRARRRLGAGQRGPGEVEAVRPPSPPAHRARRSSARWRTCARREAGRAEAALKALVAEVTGLPRAAVRPPQAELSREATWLGQRLAALRSGGNRRPTRRAD